MLSTCIRVPPFQGGANAEVLIYMYVIIVGRVVCVVSARVCSGVVVGQVGNGSAW